MRLALINTLLVVLLLAPSANAESLRVGITEVPPFAMQDAEGNWEGISYELWQTIAANLGHEYELVPLSLEGLLSGARDGSIDIAVGALTMTAEREAQFDFSHPFYQTGLSIAVPAAPQAGILRSLWALLSWEFLSLIAGLGLLLLVMGFLLWIFERRRNPEQFGGTPAEGIGASFWWAAVTMTTVGYGDKAPISLGGRLIALVWMFAGLIMVASFTAAITSTLTVSNLQGGIAGPQDLPGHTVATVGNTASASYLSSAGIRQRHYADLGEAMQAVADGEVDAVVYDRPLLQYRKQLLGLDELQILPAQFDDALYAFALPSGSPYRGPVAQQVLGVTETNEWRNLITKYLGVD